MVMANLEQRLTRLEKVLDSHTDALTWADAYDAHARQQVRAYVKICRLLGVDAHDRRVAEAISRLAGDDEARIARDAAIMARWREQQGLMEDPAEIRQRFTKRLEAIARRLQAG
jgi:hypothetical protein